MHPFGGTPRCHRCEKLVYAAEQIMGPGRMLYHKPCLKCASCNKRLDSLSLMEHDKEPYCKQCHVKLFGTVDLRHGNLPHRDEVEFTSPTRPSRSERGRVGASPPPPSPSSPTRASLNGGRRASPTSSGRRGSSMEKRRESEDEGLGRARSPPIDGSLDSLRMDDGDEALAGARARARARARSHSRNRGLGNNRDGLDTDNDGFDDDDRFDEIPRARPFSPSDMSRAHTSPKLSSADTGSSSISGSPLRPSVTGTRYGVALTGRPLSPLSTGSTTSSWSSRSRSRAMPGTGTPLCARCSKPVYFAEQTKAVGKTFHKLCLRCSECGTALDSTRIAERDGQVVCRSCYGKLYGPQGSGYALLGKAGG